MFFLVCGVGERGVFDVGTGFVGRVFARGWGGWEKMTWAWEWSVFYIVRVGEHCGWR